MKRYIRLFEEHQGFTAHEVQKLRQLGILPGAEEELTINPEDLDWLRFSASEEDEYAAANRWVSATGQYIIKVEGYLWSSGGILTLALDNRGYISVSFLPKYEMIKIYQLGEQVWDPEWNRPKSMLYKYGYISSPQTRNRYDEMQVHFDQLQPLVYKTGTLIGAVLHIVDQHWPADYK